MGCKRFDAGCEDYPALVWRRREEWNELVGEQVMAKHIGREDFPERRLVPFAVAAFNVEVSGACLSSSRLAGDA